MNGFEISCGSDRVLKVGVTDLPGVDVDAIKSDAIGGFNSFLADQKKLDGAAINRS